MDMNIDRYNLYPNVCNIIISSFCSDGKQKITVFFIIIIIKK